MKGAVIAALCFSVALAWTEESDYNLETISVSSIYHLDISSLPVRGMTLVEPGNLLGSEPTVYSAISSALRVPIAFEEVSLDTQRGRSLFKAVKPDHLPAYILGGSFKSAPSYKALLKSKAVLEKGGNYLVRARGTSKKLLKRKPMPNSLEVFVRCFCPHAISAQRVLFEAKAQGKLPPDFHLVMRYVASPSRKENEEAQRQAVIQKHFPEKFPTYISHRDSEAFSSWEESSRASGIDPIWLSRTAEKKGIGLLKEDKRLAKELDVIQTPAFLFHNQYLIYNMSLLSKFPELFSLNISSHTPGHCPE